MLSERHIKELEDRSLCVENATRMGIYSGRRFQDGSNPDGSPRYVVRPDSSGNILCFPFFEYDEEVNTKYRAYNKDGERLSWQRSRADGAIKTPFNANSFLDDESLLELESGVTPLIWTEGEPDCIAVVQCGFPLACSLPDGAMPGRTHDGKLINVPEGTSDIDPESDDKFSFFARHFERLMQIKLHLIAFDDDDSGRRMAKEMVRRVGAARCLQIHYPPDEKVIDKDSKKLRPCKDLNEVLHHFGAAEVERIINDAKPWPVRGLYKLSDYPDTPPPEVYDTGISGDLDQLFKLYPGAFIPVTGLPGSGKSTLVNQIAVQMAKIHKWPVAMFTGEEAIKPFIAQELMTAYLGKHKDEWTRNERERAREFVEHYFCFIDHDPRDDREDIDLEFWIDKCSTAVFRYGVRLAIADPWNEFEHAARPGSVSLTEYTGSCIRKVKRFNKSYDCASFVVAHPTKIPTGDTPGLYNISDSAHWANKADLGLIVHADDPNSTLRRVIIPKVRHSGYAGRRGECWLDFDTRTELFFPGSKPAIDPLAEPFNLPSKKRR